MSPYCDLANGWTNAPPEVGKKYWFIWLDPKNNMYRDLHLATWYQGDQWTHGTEWASGRLRSMLPVPDPIPPMLPVPIKHPSNKLP